MGMGRRWGRRSRAAVAAAVVASVVMLLAGCSSTGIGRVAGQRLVAWEQAKPQAGQCWDAKYTTIDKVDRNIAQANVPCSDPHQSYTVAVPTLKGKLPSSWVGSDPDTGVAAKVEEAAGGACVHAQDKLLPNLSYDSNRIYLSWKLPTLEAWSHGARWARCDLSEIAIGSSIASPVFAKLPAFATIRTGLASDPGQFAVCVDENDVTPVEYGPRQNGAVFADCADSPDWVMKKLIVVPYPDSGDYPGTQKLDALGTTKCLTPYTDKAKHMAAYYYYPSESAWNEGDNDMHCWVTTEVHDGLVG